MGKPHKSASEESSEDHSRNIFQPLLLPLDLEPTQQEQDAVIL